MKVTYGTQQIAPGGLQGTMGASWNGQQINDEAQFFRAAAANFFPRGNRSSTFAFGVNVNLNTEADAMVYAATLLNYLEQQADLVVTDEAGTYTVTLGNAVLESLDVVKIDGKNVTLRFQFRGGVWTSATLIPGLDTVKRGSIALAVNDETKAISFGTAFSGAPAMVECWVVPASTSSVRFIQAEPLSDTITANGFTAGIAFPIPETGYVLMWEAWLLESD
jgi:hypothetical protein